MVLSSLPSELETANTVELVNWTCARCRYTQCYSNIAVYNLYMGLLFPLLWVVNGFLLFRYWLLDKDTQFCKKHACADRFWARVWGYSVTALAIYITLACGLYVITQVKSE